MAYHYYPSAVDGCPQCEPRVIACAAHAAESDAFYARLLAARRSALALDREWCAYRASVAGLAKLFAAISSLSSR